MSNRFQPPRSKRQWIGNVLTNLDAPIPLPRKLYLLTRNAGKRLIRRTACCGNHGEPGC